MNLAKLIFKSLDRFFDFLSIPNKHSQWSVSWVGGDSGVPILKEFETMMVRMPLNILMLPVSLRGGKTGAAFNKRLRLDQVIEEFDDHRSPADWAL